MNRLHFLLAITLSGAGLIVAPSIQSHEPQPASAARLLTAASDFLSSLSPEQRQKAVFTPEDPERKDWSNLPHTLHPRKGVSLGELPPHNGSRRAVIRAGDTLEIAGTNQLGESVRATPHPYY